MRFAWFALSAGLSAALPAALAAALPVLGHHPSGSWDFGIGVSPDFPVDLPVVMASLTFLIGFVGAALWDAAVSFLILWRLGKHGRGTASEAVGGIAGWSPPGQAVREFLEASTAMETAGHADLIAMGSLLLGPASTVDRPLMAGMFSRFPILIAGLAVVPPLAAGIAPEPLALTIGLGSALAVYTLFHLLRELRYRQADRLQRILVIRGIASTCAAPSRAEEAVKAWQAVAADLSTTANVNRELLKAALLAVKSLGKAADSLALAGAKAANPASRTEDGPVTPLILRSLERELAELQKSAAEATKDLAPLP